VDGVIRAEEVHRGRILTGVSVEVRTGEVLAVVGPNGAGKSTLLKVLSGEWRTSEGRVELNGRALREWGEAERARVLSVLPQASTLEADFTALEVALMGRNPHVIRRETPWDIEIAREALAAVEAAHLSGKRYPELSGGEQQSVQLARVLAQVWESADANLLLDEPTANLDLAQQHRMLEVARSFARKGAAVLVILHDLNLAAEYSDRIAVLKEGRMIDQGTPAEVLTAGKVLAAFQFAVTVTPHPVRGVPMVFPK